MANTIEYAKIFQPELDAAAVEQATSGWMEVNRDLVRYSGGDEVKIPNVVMDGLADYDRANGFVAGSVDLSWQTMKMTKDRGRSFQIDENDVDESGFVLAAASLMGEFQRVHVVPEIDAYRYSTIAQKCMGADLAAYSYTPAESSILKALLDDIAAVQDVVGENTPLIVSISTLVLNLLNNSDKLSRRLDVTDFSQGDVTVKVKSLNGIPLRSVPSGRMKSKYVFQDGKTAGQEKADLRRRRMLLTLTGSSRRRTPPSRFPRRTRCGSLTRIPTRRPGHGAGITGDTMICGSRRKSSRPAVRISNRQNRPLWNRKKRRNGGETQMTSEQLTWITGEVMASLKLSDDKKSDVERCIRRIGTMVLIRCNREDIPKMLEPVIAQMAEDTLKEEMNLSGAGAVSSVTRGDTSITYRDDTALTQASSRLLKDYEPQLRRYKKMNLPK